MKQKVIYYSDELNDDFASNNIREPVIDEKYRYGNSSFLWKLNQFFFYRVIITPIAFVLLKLLYHYKIVNGDVLKKYKDNGCFVYGNHTNGFGDALIPTFLSFPKRAYLIVNPASVNVPLLGDSTKFLGAIPLPGTPKAARNYVKTLKLRISEKAPIFIYPEAHIWPYYTKIRPFVDFSFRYPVQAKVPAFSFTTTYQKRFLSPIPKMVVYVDGPFYPDENLTYQQQKTDLRNKVYNAMCERSKLNTVEKIKYVKK